MDAGGPISRSGEFRGPVEGRKYGRKSRVSARSRAPLNTRGTGLSEWGGVVTEEARRGARRRAARGSSEDVDKRVALSEARGGHVACLPRPGPTPRLY